MIVHAARQLGFDFHAVEPPPAPTPGEYEHGPETEPSAAGIWLAPRCTKREFTRRIEAARRPDSGLDELLRALLARVLDAAQRHLPERLRLDEPIEWHGQPIAVSADEAEQLAACCARAAAANPLNARAVDRSDLRLRAFYLDALGTLALSAWTHPGQSGEPLRTRHLLEFTPGRDPVLLESYQDRQPIHTVPAAVWEPAYCAHFLCESGDRVASVPTFSWAGRCWINDGMVHGGGRRACCEGWSVLAREDWHGATYSYRSQCDAWDEGRLERGDRRGLVVSVRGQLCVLDGSAVFIDPAAKD